MVVNESSSRSFLAFRPRGHRTKAPSCPSSWSLKARNLPLSCVRSASQRRREEGREGRRKEERNGTAGSVSEPYISAGTNCPIIHSVRQLRCSPLIHRCYFPPSSPFLLLPFLLSLLPFSSLLSSSSLSLPSEAMVRASRGTFGFCLAVVFPRDRRASVFLLPIRSYSGSDYSSLDRNIRWT